MSAKALSGELAMKSLVLYSEKKADHPVQPFTLR